VYDTPPILDQPRMAGVLPEAIRLSIEIEFAAGARMGITGTVDAATLRAVVGALADGRQR
jgi:transposase